MTNYVQLTVSGAGGTNSATNYIVVKPRPSLGMPVLRGGKFIFTGGNGPAGQTYRILTATNLTAGWSNWTVSATNWFNPDGSYAFTNAGVTNQTIFFRMVSP